MREIGSGTGVAVVAQLVARQAAAAGDHLLAGVVFGERGAAGLRDPGRGGHFDGERRAGVGALIGQERHRPRDHDERRHRYRAPLGPALGTPVEERQQEQQDEAERRDADRRQRHEARRLDHPQHLEQEEEVPLRPRHVGGRGRIGLGAELGAEHERQADDHRQHHACHSGVLGDGIGEERLALRLQDRVLAEVLLLLELVHAFASRRSAEFSAFSHGGAVVPSLVTRYRCAPIKAMIRPGTSSMWME